MGGITPNFPGMSIKTTTSVNANTDLVRLLMEHEYLAWAPLDENKDTIDKGRRKYQTNYKCTAR